MLDIYVLTIMVSAFGLIGWVLYYFSDKAPAQKMARFFRKLAAFLEQD